jgi:hypothetical protein
MDLNEGPLSMIGNGTANGWIVSGCRRNECRLWSARLTTANVAKGPIFAVRVARSAPECMASIDGHNSALERLQCSRRLQIYGQTGRVKP